jgi:hypothetical protein
MAKSTERNIERLLHNILDGMVLVHNHVQPQRTLGAQGFRAWMEPFDETKHIQCDCRWPAMFGRAARLHYRTEVAEKSAVATNPGIRDDG